MSETVITIIGAVVGVAALGVLIAVVVFAVKFAARLQGAGVDQLAASAAARGWHFEHSREIGKITRTWSGVTDGLAWTAEHIGTSNNSAGDRHRQHTFRWRTTLAGGPAAPLVLVHERSSLHGIDRKTHELPGLLRDLASAAIDRVAEKYFGTDAADVDLSAWRAVDGHALPGMRVLAPDGAADSLLICQRLARPIEDAAALTGGGDPPVILIRRGALHLASRSDVSAADVERAVALGVGIARALAPRST